ncbi:MAG: YraN family protein [Anaerolineales bacterium]|nr:YraN family protein [Anaerolineales bacterium]
MSKQGVGKRGEQIARRQLEEAGYRILVQNWYCRYGEMDLIAKKNGEWVFVEVKTRRSNSYGTPEDALTRAKKRSLVRTAVQYLIENELDVDWRIDCIAIEMDQSGRVVRCEHFYNVVEGELNSWV